MCTPIPKVPPLSLGGLSIAPIPLGNVTGDVDFCCKRLGFAVPLPPIPLPLVNGAITGIFAAACKTINNYIDSLELSCSLE